MFIHHKSEQDNSFVARLGARKHGPRVHRVVSSDLVAKIRWILAVAEIIFCLIGLVLFFKKTKLPLSLTLLKLS